MAKLLQGKVVLVTGAGSPIGLGRAMTLALVQAGARVAMLDRNREWLAHTLEEVHEPFLVQEGYVVRTPQGRVLAPKGWLAVGLRPPSP